MGMTPEQEHEQEHERAFAEAAELARELSAKPSTAAFDREVWRRLAGHGLLRMLLPDPASPGRTGVRTVFAAFEGLGYGGLDDGVLFAVGAHLWTAVLPFRDFGSDEQKRRYLPGLVSGDLVAANAATEHDTGSDVFALTTRAVRDGDHYVLTGGKTLITNAPVADLFIIYATLDPGLGPMGITAFLVEGGTPGLEPSPPMEKMGLHASLMGNVTLDSCRVPADHVLGRPGRGVEVFATAMRHERPGLLASSLGIMRRQLEDCVRRARTRHQAGGPIGRHQAVAHRIADMKVRLDAAHALTYRAADLLDAGQDADQASAVAKLFTANAYLQSCLDTMQIHGGHSYLTATGIEGDVRNAIGNMFSSGTSDIQHNIIARGLGL
jgi:alkylation response protein AidB-like acyl-CoA dehydrogenase